MKSSKLPIGSTEFIAEIEKSLRDRATQEKNDLNDDAFTASVMARIHHEPTPPRISTNNSKPISKIRWRLGWHDVSMEALILAPVGSIFAINVWLAGATLDQAGRLANTPQSQFWAGALPQWDSNMTSSALCAVVLTAWLTWFAKQAGDWLTDPDI